MASQYRPAYACSWKTPLRKETCKKICTSFRINKDQNSVSSYQKNEIDIRRLQNNYHLNVDITMIYICN